LNPNSEVVGDGDADDAMPECARPRHSNWPPSIHGTLPNRLRTPARLRPGRPHSANAEIQLRTEFGLKTPHQVRHAKPPLPSAEKARQAAKKGA